MDRIDPTLIGGPIHLHLWIHLVKKYRRKSYFQFAENILSNIQNFLHFDITFQHFVILRSYCPFLEQRCSQSQLRHLNPLVLPLIKVLIRPSRYSAAITMHLGEVGSFNINQLIRTAISCLMTSLLIELVLNSFSQIRVQSNKTPFHLKWLCRVLLYSFHKDMVVKAVWWKD